MKRGLRINSTHKLFYIISSVLILFLIGTGVHAALPIPGANAPNPGHSSDQIFINYSGNFVTFEHAVERRYLIGDHNTIASEISSSDPNNLPDNTFPKTTPWHYASDILIKVNSSTNPNVQYTMTLQEAIDHDVFKNGANKNYTTNLPAGGQTGNEIDVSVGGTPQPIQGIINAGDFLCKPFTAAEVCGDFQCGTADNGCRGTVNCGSNAGGCEKDFNCVINTNPQTQVCVYKDSGSDCTPANVDSRCASGFTYQNDGSCAGGTYSSGNLCSYSCGNSGCGFTANYYCNGAGSCVYVAPTSSGDHTSSSTSTSSPPSWSQAANPGSGTVDTVCFTANQRVLTPSGEIPIDQIKPGDVVISYNSSSKSLTTSVVQNVIVHDGKNYFLAGVDHAGLSNYLQDPLLRITVQESSGKSTATEVTSNHPYYDLSTNTYKEIRYFNVGDKVKTYDGQGIITGKETIIDGNSTPSEKSTVVYNLELEGKYHNFFVNGILVHNYA